MLIISVKIDFSEIPSTTNPQIHLPVMFAYREYFRYENVRLVGLRAVINLHPFQNL